jgi:hypothetical protein
MSDWDEVDDLAYELRNNPERVGQSLVACIDSGGGYNWTVFYIFRDMADGTLRWWSGSGCSCNQPLDGVNVLADLTTGTERDLVTDLHAYAGESYSTDLLHSYVAAMQSDWFKQINALAEGQKR